MNIHTGTCTEPQTKDCHLHQIGVDPDRNRHRSTLKDFILMGGFIPMDEVSDLLPFRSRTLRNWARRGPFASCFRRMHIGPCGNSILFINVNHFAHRFEELAEQSLRQDSKMESPEDPSMNAVGGLDEFAELVRRIKHL